MDRMEHSLGFRFLILSLHLFLEHFGFVGKGGEKGNGTESPAINVNVNRRKQDSLYESG